MQLHSFQDTALILLTHVKDFQEQIVEGLTILRYLRGRVTSDHCRVTVQ